MATSFITNTASLKTTIADVRKLNAKKLFLGGENILDIIKRATPTIKHSQDTRETVTENDLWGQYIETLEDGTIIIHDDWVTNPNASSGWNSAITKVESNKAYVNDTLYGNIQTENIKNGLKMFHQCSKLTSFSSDLPSLTDGKYMFYFCYSLTTFNSKLSSLTNGDNMFNYCHKLNSFKCDNLYNLTRGGSMFRGCPIASFDYNLVSLTDGGSMFQNCSSLKNFKSTLPNLTQGNSMFSGCSNLNTFTINLPTLIIGSGMFSDCSNLTLFVSDLPNLTKGGSMFSNCKKLTSFDCYNLYSLTNGDSMFSNCVKLTSFNSNLSSLTSGSDMFYNCTALTSFSSDLSNLLSGYRMFSNCTALTSFSSDLSSLLSANQMFSNCYLNAETVMYIADTIKDINSEKQLYIDGIIPYITSSNNVYSAPKGFKENGDYVVVGNNGSASITPAANIGLLTLGINVTNNADTIQQQLEDFAKEATFDSWDDLKTHFSNKGWTVTFQYGGTTDTIPDTYGLRGGEQIIPCPIFAKLVESDEDSAEYCTEDASTFYNIEWGHDVTDTSSYTQFDSLEDAMASWNVFPKENIITSEEE